MAGLVLATTILFVVLFAVIVIFLPLLLSIKGKEPFVEDLAARPTYLSVLHVRPRAVLTVCWPAGVARETLDPELETTGLVRVTQTGEGETECSLVLSDVSFSPMAHRIHCVLPELVRTLFLVAPYAGPDRTPKTLGEYGSGDVILFETDAAGAAARAALSVYHDTETDWPALVKTASVAASLLQQRGREEEQQKVLAAVFVFPGQVLQDLERQQVTIISYDDSAPARDAHLARMSLGPLHRRAVDVKRTFPRHMGARRSMLLLCAHGALIDSGRKEVEERLEIAEALTEGILLRRGRDAVALNNYYREIVGLRYSPGARRALRRANARFFPPAPAADVHPDDLVVGRPDQAVLEQFSTGEQQQERQRQRKIELRPAAPLPGLHVRRHDMYPGVKVASLDSPVLEGTPVRRGDRVLLRKEELDFQNGDYIVSDVAPNGATALLSPPVLFFVHAKQTQPSYFGPDAGTGERVAFAGGAYWDAVVGDRVFVVNTSTREYQNGTSGIIESIDESGEFIVLLQQDEGRTERARYYADKFHPLALCSTDSKIDIRELCPGVWDRPCEKDEDCPFFQANTHYRNYRGGCIAGYCELPLGLQRAGYRGFTGRPRCHGCPHGDGGRCCAAQARPQYAFPLDQFSIH